MDQKAIEKLIEQKVQSILETREKQRSNFVVPIHYHNNIDSPYIPANAPVTNVAPTGGNNGDIMLYISGGTYRLYAKIEGTWRYVALT